MGVQQRYENDYMTYQKYIHVSTGYDEKKSYLPLDISEYNTLMTVVGTNTSAPAASFISVDIDNETLTVRDGANTETFSISEFIGKLRAIHRSTNSYSIPQDKLELSLVSENHEIRIFFESFSYKNPKYDAKKSNEYNSSYSL